MEMVGTFSGPTRVFVFIVRERLEVLLLAPGYKNTLRRGPEMPVQRGLARRHQQHQNTGGGELDAGEGYK